MSRLKNKYIGDKNFYKYVLAIAVPMILQNLITNFVSMLDNIMVGQVGTAQMSGVSIVNQFIFVFNITIFGGMSGASIFGTQFFGKEDSEGQKYTFRYRLLLATGVLIVSALVLSLFGSNLISLYLSPDDSPEMIRATLQYGEQYLRIMLLGLIPFCYGQAYASVVRECGETKIPMYGSLAAIGINLFFDYALIFGKFGFPEMGVIGAAIATVFAKTIEALVVIVWAHTHHERNKYIVGLFDGFHIPGDLAKQITLQGVPLLFNEFLWSVGVSVIAQCYSVRGLDVVAARNISSTITNLFGVIYIQMGSALGIIVGAKLGAGKFEEAKDCVNKMVFFSTVVTVILAILMVPVGYVFPMLYNTEPAIKQLSTFFIIVTAFAMPIWSYNNVCYFVLRSGGKTGITFLYDFGFTWVVMIPIAFFLSRYSAIDTHLLIIIVTFSESLKVLVGYLLVKSGIWINNLVA